MKRKGKQTLKRLSFTDYSPSTKHKHASGESCESLHAGSFFTPRITASALAKLSATTDKYEFVLRSEVTALRRSLIAAVFSSRRWKDADDPPRGGTHEGRLSVSFMHPNPRRMHRSALCPYLSACTRYNRERCACVLVNERLDPSFWASEGEFPHACDPANANDSTGAYS